MKKSLLNIAMALCIGLFAACSQEEIINPLSEEVETVSIDAQLPQTVGTRALPGAEANHQLRCILEVWDKADGKGLIIRIEKLATEASDGKLQFSFSVAKDVNYQCLLWADFIADNATVTPDINGNNTYANKYFNTTSLKAIDFAVNDATLFNNASADAFCGVVDKNGSTSQLSVTLKRPFTKVTLKDKTEYIDACENFNVEYETPSGYNIATGTATATKTIKATGLTPTKESKTWFSTFIFASADKETLDQDIKMTVKKTGVDTPETKTIKAGQISLDPNKENNAEANFSDDEDVKIEVDIDGEYPDPNALKIGQFVNKNGTVADTYNAETAIGIVFAIAKGKTDTSNYGEGKTIAGYAMGLTSVTRSYLGSTATEPTTMPTVPLTGTVDDAYKENDYNGYTYTNTLLTEEIKGCKSVVFDGYATWVTENTLEALNLSSWYIPSGRQIYDMSCMLFGLKNGDAIDETVKNSNFINAYNAVVETNPDATFDLGGTAGACWMMSSYMYEGNLAVITTNKPKNSTADSPIPGISTAKAPWASASRIAIRPVLTVFKQ